MIHWEDINNTIYLCTIVSDFCEDKLKGRYANFFEVGYNAFEFIIDFGQCFPECEEAQVHLRIVTSPAYAKVLLNLLRESIDHFEQVFGVIPHLDEMSG